MPLVLNGPATATGTASRPPGTAWAPDLNADPVWDAWMASYDQKRQGAQAAADLRKLQAQQDYSQALDQIQSRGLEGSRSIDNNLLARGVYQSGERGTRQGDLGKTLTLARDAAGSAFTTRRNEADLNAQAAWDALDAEREVQVATSRERLAQKQRDAEERAKILAENAAPAGSIGPAAAASAPAATHPPGWIPPAQRTPTTPGAQMSTERASTWSAPGPRPQQPPPKPKATKPKASPLKPYQGPR